MTAFEALCAEAGRLRDLLKAKRAETGEIRHRKDGRYRKRADGKWDKLADTPDAGVERARRAAGRGESPPASPTERAHHHLREAEAALREAGHHAHADAVAKVRERARDGGAAKPKAPARPSAAIDTGKVAHHVAWLEAALGDDAEFEAAHRDLAGHSRDHVHAVAKTFAGGAGRSKAHSLKLIRRRHNILVGARARVANQDGRIAG